MAQDKQKPQGTGTADKVQGEGDYDAARRYEEKLRDHVQHHDMDREARDAEPRSEGEKRDMEQAEQLGKQRAKEEDPLLKKPGKAESGADKSRRGPGGRKA